MRHAALACRIDVCGIQGMLHAKRPTGTAPEPPSSACQAVLRAETDLAQPPHARAGHGMLHGHQ